MHGLNQAQQTSAADLLVPKIPGLSFSSSKTRLVQDEATGLTRAYEQRTEVNPTTSYLAVGDQATQGAYLLSMPLRNVSVADVLSPALLGSTAQQGALQQQRLRQANPYDRAEMLHFVDDGTAVKPSDVVAHYDVSVKPAPVLSAAVQPNKMSGTHT